MFFDPGGAKLLRPVCARALNVRGLLPRLRRLPIIRFRATRRVLRAATFTTTGVLRARLRGEGDTNNTRLAAISTSSSVEIMRTPPL